MTWEKNPTMPIAGALQHGSYCRTLTIHLWGWGLLGFFKVSR